MSNGRADRARHLPSALSGGQPQRVAMLSMRDGAFIDETRLTGGSTGRPGGSAGSLGALAGLEG